MRKNIQLKFCLNLGSWNLITCNPHLLFQFKPNNLKHKAKHFLMLFFLISISGKILHVRRLNLGDTRRAELLTFITSLSVFQTVSVRWIITLDHIQTLKKMLCKRFTSIEMMAFNSEK